MSYTYAFPAYDEGTLAQRGYLGGLGGGFGEVEPGVTPISSWKGRIGFVQWDIKRALSQLSAVPLAYQSASPFFLMAQSLVTDASRILAEEERIGEWTRYRENLIDQKLAEAREKYDQGVGLAATLGANITHKMSTWVLSGPSKSAGVPSAPGEAPAQEVPPGGGGMPGMLSAPLLGVPTWAWLLGGVALVGGGMRLFR